MKPHGAQSYLSRITSNASFPKPPSYDRLTVPASELSFINGKSIMQPTSHPIRSSRKSRLITNIVPDQSLDTETNPPCLPCFFSGKVECCYLSRLVDEDSSEGHRSSASVIKVEAAIESEVADWWQLRYMDEFWMPRNKQQRLVWRTYTGMCGTCLIS
jgi:hypothetical protein